MSRLALVEPSFAGVYTGVEAGALVDQVRSDCGFIVRAIDWLTNKIGFDLIGTILGPLEGDYPEIDNMRANWAVLGKALGEVGQNYRALAAATPAVWTGDDAVAAAQRMGDYAAALADAEEACYLLQDAIEAMIQATQTILDVAAGALALVEEVVLTFSAAKLLKEIVKGGETIRKVIAWVRRAIDAIDDLSEVATALAKAVGAATLVLKTMDTLFIAPMAARAAVETGLTADDIADKGFPT